MYSQTEQYQLQSIAHHMMLTNTASASNSSRNMLRGSLDAITDAQLLHDNKIDFEQIQRNMRS
jgi:hypothetical protein